MRSRRTSGTLRVADGLLLPGKVIGDGRYRLLEHVGTDERDGAQLWRARDGQLDRDVAVTVLAGDPADEQARRTLGRAAHRAGPRHPAIAQVLNVLSVGNGLDRGEGVVGMVVAGWTRSTALADVVARRPVAPVDACRLLEPLAEATGQAHHHGVVLGLGHPLRVRRAPGGLLLAFPGPPSQTSLGDDVRGLGAILYLLLTGRWPAPGDALASPRKLRPVVPRELSDVAMRSLEGSIRTSDTILQVLRQVSEDADRTVLLEPVGDPARKKKLAIGVAVLMTLSMAVLTWIGATVAGVFAADGGAGSGPSVTVAPTTPPPSPTQPAVAPIPPAGVAVFNVSGDADSAGSANRATDGDASSNWTTDSYFQQFPAFKQGIGLLVSFPRPVTLAQVHIDSPSAGTQVEIRTAPSANPKLADTAVVGKATLATGSTAVDLRLTTPTQHVLVWITQLGGAEPHCQSAINELAFTG